jgi:hypothetical protein
MSLISTDGWTGTIDNDRQMIDFDDDVALQGKKWECCPTCQGKGKVLVDDRSVIPRAGSVPLSTGQNDGTKRCSIR